MRPWIVLLAFLCILPQVRAAGLCPPCPLRIALYEAGFLYFDGKGVDKDLTDELKRRTGCAIEATALPRARAYLWLETGDVDIVMAAVPNPRRDTYAFFVPYMQQRFLTVMRADVPPDRATLAGFSGDPSLRLGAVRGVNYGGGRDVLYARMEAEQRLELGATLPTVFRMLKSRRFVAMFAIPLQYEKELADAGMAGEVRIVDWFPEEPPTLRCLAFSRKNFTAEQVKAWGGVVQAMQADGTIRAILARYLSRGEVTKALLRPTP
jgi:polar amino acid transport system substrate-binding protein